MELPVPVVPGWYSSAQVREILGKVSRQYLFQLAKKEGWRIREISKTNHLYKATDVHKYLISTGRVGLDPEAEGVSEDK